MYRPNSECDRMELEGDVVKEILTFVDATTSEDTDIAEVTDKVKQDLVSVDVVAETETKEEDNVLQMVRQLNRVGTGMREQCKLITDLTYELESLECGQYVLEELTGLYKYLYKNDQEHGGLLQLHKDHIRFQPLFKKRASRGFFWQRCIVPLFPSKSRKARQTKASRFGRISSQEANYITKTSANETEEEMEVVVEETTNNEDVSPFVDLEAYRGQDDRQAKSLGTPGLLQASHYILADGKVYLHESLLIFCVFT